MYQLFFEDRYYHRREIAKVNNLKEALIEINGFLLRYNFKSHYIRYWADSEEGSEKYILTIDVGSHNEYFIIEFTNKEEYENFLQQGGGANG